MEKLNVKLITTMLGIIVFVCSAGVSDFLIENRPMSPDRINGFVYSFLAHGPPVYVSKWDLLFYYGTIVGGMALVGIGLIMKGKGE